MNKEMVIDFTESGTAEALHFDEFPLGFLGEMEVRRASEILFNRNTQSWDVHVYGEPYDPLLIKDFPGYDIARQFEVQFVQTCRKVRQYPQSRFCKFLAESMRTEFLADLEKLTVKQ